MLANPPEADRQVPGTHRPWAAAVGFGVASVVGVALSGGIAWGRPILGAGWGLLGRLAVWTLAWAVAVVWALRLPRRVALAGIFTVAVALRVAALAGPPTTSDDMYRYAWDGRVQVAGIDPYRYSPDDPHLVRLRERWLWPSDRVCARLERYPGCSRVNRPSFRTIYPPVAQAWFTVVYRLAGVGARHKAWQVAGLAGDVALVALLPLALRAWGRDERWTALYALSPFPVLEVVNNGHVDGLAALLLVGALLAAGKRRPWWAGALIGAAALVKLYPAVLVLGLVGVGVGAAHHGRERWSWLAPLVRGGAAAAGVMALGYLPHVAAVGWKVLGYLPDYLQEEHYDTAGRYLLAGLLPLPDAVPALAVSVAAMAAVALWVLVRRPPAPQAFTVLIGALLLATTPVQPWYAVALLAVATVAVRPAWALVVAAGYPYFFAVILDLIEPDLIGQASYGLALAAVAVAAAAVALLRSRDASNRPSRG